jgi:hypothetical protein
VKNQKENTVKKMRRLYRIGALVGAILLPIGAVLATGTQEASATAGFQYCDYATATAECLNAWGGGPWVNVETTSNPAIQNNHFEIRYESNGNVELEFVGGGTWSGQCVGDAYNNSGYADTSLDACGSLSNGNGAGWGTQLQLQSWGPGGPCPTGDYAFYDYRWGGYLAPANGDVNGSHFYLNSSKANPICFAQQ